MKRNMSSTEREDGGDECCCLQDYDEEEEEALFDCRVSAKGDEFDDDDDDSELFEINLNNININVKDEAEDEPSLVLDTIIEEEEEEEEYCESTVFSLDIRNWKEDAVYVAVGHHRDHIFHSSMGALSWALNHALTPSGSSSTTLYLLHVFPLIKLIPSPLGKIPRSHVNLEYVNRYLNQKMGKTKLLLQKFIDLCVDSKVKVEMILIEGDNVAEAIVELVVKRDIRKLVIGTTASNSTRESARRNGTAKKVFKNAQESCDVKIICEGREMTTTTRIDNSSSPRSKDSSSSCSSQDEDEPPRALMRLIWLFRPRLSSPR